MFNAALFTITKTWKQAKCPLTEKGIQNMRYIYTTWASLIAQSVKYLPAMMETQVRFLGWEDPLEKEMATHSSILAWRIPWTESLAGYSPWGHKSETRLSNQTTIYYLAIKKWMKMTFVTTWMDPQIITLSEVSQRKTCIIRYHLYVQS